MPYILKKYYPLRNILFFFGEGGLIFLLLSTAFLLFDPADSLPFTPHLLRALTVTVIFQLCLYFFDLYDLSSIPQLTDTAIRITQAFGFGCIALAGLYYLFPPLIISTRIFWSGYIFTFIALLCWRALYALILERRMFAQKLLIIGTGNLARDIVDAVNRKVDSGYTIKAIIGPPTADLTDHITLLADCSNLLQHCRNLKIDRIIVALDDQRGAMPIKELLQCKLEGMRIENGITFYESLSGRIMVERVSPSWFIFSSGFNKSRLITIGKRQLDLVVSICGLLMASPVILLSAVLIKIESPGPVFYRQERVGLKGQPFKVIKFRSMRQDAEKHGPVWAAQNDDRTTRSGALMRKLRIDEIPQMWNVLKGEMSFVGPRPERPVFVAQLEKKIPYYSLRHSIKPGITGWAQVFYPYGASEEDALRKLEYDLYYIKNMNLAMDLWTIFYTIKTVLFQKGAR